MITWIRILNLEIFRTDPNPDPKVLSMDPRKKSNFNFVLQSSTFQNKKIIIKYVAHRIKYYRMENSIKGIQIWHCAFTASIILFSTPTEGGRLTSSPPLPPTTHPLAPTEHPYTYYLLGRSVGDQFFFL